MWIAGYLKYKRNLFEVFFISKPCQSLLALTDQNKTMKTFLSRLVLLFIMALFVFSCKRTTTIAKDGISKNYVSENYTKQEVDIEMRDGITLHTTIYSPRDTSKKYPILMQRTPYSSQPYGEGNFREQIGPNIHLMQEGNIIVYQDVRGRWLSEGHYENMRAYIPNKTTDDQVD